MADLWEKRGEHNQALFSHLREDKESQWLFEHTMAEAGAGRTSVPCTVGESSSMDAIYQPRFVVEQNRPDGSRKLRAIDNGSWAPKGNGKEESVNGFTMIADSISHHTLDHLSAALRMFYWTVGCLPHLFKADIDNAFRRVPVAPDQRKYCGIAFKHNKQVFSAVHFSCPLGAIGSVLAWERVGSAILYVARVRF